MKTIAIANQKGGVGKTAITLLLASALNAAGRRALVLDLDPQANLTSGAAVAGDGETLADLLLAPTPPPLTTVLRSSVWGFDVAPSSVTLASKERSRRLGDEHDLAALLTPLRGYDVALVDCPPSLGVLTVNALTAADAVLVVAEPAAFALHGVLQLLETVEVIRRHYNPRLHTAGLLLNLCDHTRDTRHHLDDATTAFGQLVLESRVPRRAAIREAITTATPLAAISPARHSGLDTLLDETAAEVLDRV